MDDGPAGEDDLLTQARGEMGSAVGQVSGKLE
jgi:hypothetical protein